MSKPIVDKLVHDYPVYNVFKEHKSTDKFIAMLISAVKGKYNLHLSDQYEINCDDGFHIGLIYMNGHFIMHMISMYDMQMGTEERKVVVGLCMNWIEKNHIALDEAYKKFEI